MKYTPFPGKPTSELIAADLEALKSVGEGWYVEYKRNLPNQRSTAKSIAALANTYGGWLFIGVEESSKSNNTASACPGIPKAEMDTHLQKIRQSVSDHLSPTPHFDTQVVWGPNEELGLPMDHGVICIEVGQSPLAPHIHSDGRVFRRVADSSEPIAETDRYQMELLWNRQKEVHETYKQWIQNKPELSERETDRPYVRLLLEADHYGAKGKQWLLSKDQIKNAMNSKTAGTLIPVETIYPSGQGWVARQTSSLARHEDFGLTWLFRDPLRCEVWIPVTCVDYSDPLELEELLVDRAHTARLIKILEGAKSSESRILELTQVFMVLTAVSTSYLKLLSEAGHEIDSIHAKAIVDGVWRTIPFVDSEFILGEMEKFGLPLCLTSEAQFPKGSDADGFCQIRIVKEAKDDEIRNSFCAIMLFELICRALGLVGFVSAETTDDKARLYTELVEAFHRTNKKYND